MNPEMNGRWRPEYPEGDDEDAVFNVPLWELPEMLWDFPHGRMLTWIMDGFVPLENPILVAITAAIEANSEFLLSFNTFRRDEVEEAIMVRVYRRSAEYERF